MQNILFKYFVFWAAQKWETSRSEYVYFKSTNFIKFCYFCVAHNTKNFVVNFFIFIDYIIDYVLIYFYNFWNLKLWFKKFKKWREHWSPPGAKSTFRIRSSYMRTWVRAFLQLRPCTASPTALIESQDSIKGEFISRQEKYYPNYINLVLSFSAK
jgi:hypothetical protein